MAQGRRLGQGERLGMGWIRGDGAILGRRALDCDPDTGARRWTDRAFAYARYRTADLAYAVTGHSAQGRTVRVGIPVVTGAEDRQWLYVAMTRGSDENVMVVFTQSGRAADPQAGTRPAPELGRHSRIDRERAALPAAPAQALADGGPPPPGGGAGEAGSLGRGGGRN